MPEYAEALATPRHSSLVVKGPAIDPLLARFRVTRHAGDLDLLVDPKHIERATKVLGQNGYQPLPNDLPCFTDKRLSQKQSHHIRAFESHVRFTHPDKQTLVELHWKLTPNSDIWFPTFDQLWDQRESVRLGTNEVPTLSPVDSLVHLLIHGAFHGWFRLFWLFEFALQITHTSQSILQRFIQQAQQHHYSIALSAAVENFHQIFDIRLPIVSDTAGPVPRIVLDYPQSLLNTQIQTNQRPIGHSIRHRLYQFRLLETPAAKRAALQQYCISPADFSTLTIPDSMFFLYAILRPFFWFKNKMTNHPSEKSKRI